jgi:hypothetical protein
MDLTIAQFEYPDVRIVKSALHHKTSSHEYGCRPPTTEFFGPTDIYDSPSEFTDHLNLNTEPIHISEPDFRIRYLAAGNVSVGIDYTNHVNSPCYALLFFRFARLLWRSVANFLALHKRERRSV